MKKITRIDFKSQIPNLITLAGLSFGLSSTLFRIGLGTTLTMLHGKTTISIEYQPCQYTLDWITKTYGEHYDYNQEREIFIDYYKSTGAIKSDWHASFRNWLRRAHKFANARKNTESNLVVSSEGVQERRQRISNVTNIRLKTQTKD